MIALGEAECCALAGTDCRPPTLRRRGGRPQLKRGPLGGRGEDPEALKFQNAIGRATIDQRARQLAQRFIADLGKLDGVKMWTSLDPSRSAAIVDLLKQNEHVATQTQEIEGGL